LERVPVDEGLLEWMELVVIGQAFDRDDGDVVMGDGECEAAVDPAAVDEDGACTALAVVAALLGAGQAELVAQEVEQGETGVDDEAVMLAVDAEGERQMLGLKAAGIVRRRAQKWARQSTQSSHVRGQFGDQSVPM
jgi:hypothetical protein